MERWTARAAGALLVLAGAAALQGCTQPESEDAQTMRTATAELSAVLLRPEAEEAFEREGHPVRGGLECRSRTREDEPLTVVCTGRSAEDGKLRFRGRIDPGAVASQPDLAEGLPGTYTGTADGDEVFRMNCFNCEPGELEEDSSPAASPS
ncbi:MULTISPECIES: hypothetical protein [Streptomonospora]|uniref:Lipoprotein n=2 Tax=Streptomonospora TaxID=104204 RepID=A0ABV9SR73_9ACTN